MGLLYVNIGDVNQGIDVIPSIMEFKGIYGITSILEKGGITLNKAVSF